MNAMQVAVPVPLELFQRLSEFLKEEGDSRDPIRAAWDAIDYWIDNASWKPELIRQERSSGYTWKYDDRCLFLPHGTEIRMPHKGKYHYAVVEGDEIKYNGQTMTPGTLANTIANGSRNAWISLWIKRPGDNEWTLADRLSPTSKSRSAADRLLDEVGSTNPSAK
jgi:hypothetical protein